MNKEIYNKLNECIELSKLDNNIALQCILHAVLGSMAAGLKIEMVIEMKPVINKLYQLHLTSEKVRNN